MWGRLLATRHGLLQAPAEAENSQRERERGGNREDLEVKTSKHNKAVFFLIIKTAHDHKTLRNQTDGLPCQRFRGLPKEY